MSTVISSPVILSGCLSVHALKEKWLELYVDRHILHGRPSACIGPDIKRSNIRVVDMMGRGMGLHVDMSAHFSSYLRSATTAFL